VRTIYREFEKKEQNPEAVGKGAESKSHSFKTPAPNPSPEVKIIKTYSGISS
jgi:hypothetical protein